LNGDDGDDDIYGDENDTVTTGGQSGDTSAPTGPTDLDGNPCVFPAPGYAWKGVAPVPFRPSDPLDPVHSIALGRDYPWRWSNDIHVRVEFIDGTAVNGMDFEGPTSIELTIPNSFNDPYAVLDWPQFDYTILPDEDGVIEDTNKTFFIRYTTIEREPCGDSAVQTWPVDVYDRTIIAVDDIASAAPTQSRAKLGRASPAIRREIRSRGSSKWGRPTTKCGYRTATCHSEPGKNERATYAALSPGA
jgi:hypothetical protein